MSATTRSLLKVKLDQAYNRGGWAGPQGTTQLSNESYTTDAPRRAKAPCAFGSAHGGVCSHSARPRINQDAHHHLKIVNATCKSTPWSTLRKICASDAWSRAVSAVCGPCAKTDTTVFCVNRGGCDRTQPWNGRQSTSCSLLGQLGLSTSEVVFVSVPQLSGVRHASAEATTWATTGYT